MFKVLMHKDVYFPGNVQEITRGMQERISEIEYSEHIKEHFSTIRDRSHNYCGDRVMACIETLSNTPRESFEVEVGKDYRFFGRAGFFVTKYCVRIPYDDYDDVVVVLRPVYEDDGTGRRSYRGRCKVATAWLNQHDDAHFTLDGERYCSKDEWMGING